LKVFVFESTRAVIKSEAAVREGGIDCTVIPVPRSVSPHCGMALQIEDEDEAAAGELLSGLRIKTEIFDRSEVKL